MQISQNYHFGFEKLMFPVSLSSHKIGGTHGYEDITDGYETEGNFPDVRTIFLAIGPAFKSNYSNPWIKLVDEYQIMMHTLNAVAMPNNGTWDRVKCMFKNEKCDENNGASSVNMT